jgi:hypothetical protein
MSTRSTPHNKRNRKTKSKRLSKDLWKTKARIVAILLSDRTDFTQKSVRRDKDGHYIKGTIQHKMS